MENDYYEFKCKIGNLEVTHKYNGDCASDEMYYFIREFLLGASWQPETVDEIMGRTK